MINYLIDGNNVIGKFPSIKKLEKKDKQLPRERLAFLVDTYFFNKKVKVKLFFDGFENLPIKVSKIKLAYSNNKTADDLIKNEIGKSNSKRNITVVSSDNNIREFAKVCGCKILLSEEFILLLNKNDNSAEEEEIIKKINDVEEFKKLFGVN